MISDERLSIFLPAELKRRLRDECYLSGDSQASIIREALEVRLTEREALRKVEE